MSLSFLLVILLYYIVTIWLFLVFLFKTWQRGTKYGKSVCMRTRFTKFSLSRKRFGYYNFVIFFITKVKALDLRLYNNVIKRIFYYRVTLVENLRFHILLQKTIFCFTSNELNFIIRCFNLIFSFFRICRLSSCIVQI